jgi:hypothetical protein
MVQIGGASVAGRDGRCTVAKKKKEKKEEEGGMSASGSDGCEHAQRKQRKLTLSSISRTGWGTDH